MKLNSLLSKLGLTGDKFPFEYGFKTGMKIFFNRLLFLVLIWILVFFSLIVSFVFSAMLNSLK